MNDQPGTKGRAPRAKTPNNTPAVSAGLTNWNRLFFRPGRKLLLAILPYPSFSRNPGYPDSSLDLHVARKRLTVYKRRHDVILQCNMTDFPLFWVPAADPRGRSPSKIGRRFGFQAPSQPKAII